MIDFEAMRNAFKHFSPDIMEMSTNDAIDELASLVDQFNLEFPDCWESSRHNIDNLGLDVDSMPFDTFLTFTEIINKYGKGGK